MAYKQKILMLHNSMFQNNNMNNNDNFINNSEKLSIKNKENNEIETPLNTAGLEMKQNNLKDDLFLDVITSRKEQESKINSKKELLFQFQKSFLMIASSKNYQKLMTF